MFNKHRRFKKLITVLTVIFITSIMFGCAFMVNSIIDANNDGTFNITYNMNGGVWINGYTAPSTYTSEKALTLPSGVKLTKTGYTFAGWYTNSSLTGSSISNIIKGSAGKKALYAKWTLNSYSITYNLNGGSWVSSYTAPSTYTVDKTLTLPGSVKITRTGYTFAGWYSNSSLTGSSTSTINSGSTGSKTLYAKWTLSSYSITYNLNGGAWVSSYKAPGLYTINESVTLPTSVKLTREGYTFAGWYSNSGLTGSAVTVIPSSSTGSKTLYAKWSIVQTPQEPEPEPEPAVTYTITYNLNDGVWADGYTAPTTYTVNDSVTLPSSVKLTKTGYIFDGWYSNSGLTGSAVTVIPSSSTGNKILYAKWSIESTPEPEPEPEPAVTYTITYNLNDGVWADGYIAPSTYTVNDSVTLPSSVKLSREGYTFTGWYSNSGLTGSAVTVIPSSSTGNKTLYAKWSVESTPEPEPEPEPEPAVTYTITYNLNDGVWADGYIAPSTYTVNDSVTLPSSVELTKTGYIFDGWYSNSELTGSSISTINSGSTENKTLYAKWVEVATVYSITYNLGDGVWADGYTAPTTYTTVQNITLPNGSNLSNSSNIFIGWYLTSSFIGKAVTTIDMGSIGNKTLYAKWNTNQSATADNVETIIAGLQAGGSHTVFISGEITSSTISIIRTALGSNSGAKVALDFSGTTGLTSIGSQAFSSCYNLSSIVIPEGVESIEADAFSYCYNLSSIVIPEGVESIGASAFYECNNLVSVNIPESVESIGNCAFYNCSSLTSVTISNGVQTIGERAFYGCGNLTSIEIPGSVESIGNFAFSSCTNLSNLTISNGVQTIGENAFNNCSNLTSINIPSSVTSIGEFAFDSCNNITMFTVDSGNINYASSADGKLFLSKDGLILIKCFSQSDEVIIPDSVTVISNCAFSNCNNLSMLTIPNSVMVIGNAAFYNCSSLTEIVIPNSVISIGMNAFNQSNLSYVTFEDTSTWYYTSNSDYINGTVISVVDSDTNATNLKETYSSYYWYKE